MCCCKKNNRRWCEEWKRSRRTTPTMEIHHGQGQNQCGCCCGCCCKCCCNR